MRLLSVFLLSSALVVQVIGQEDAVEPSVDGAKPPAGEAAKPGEPAPDFSKGFAQLRSLGMPSVKDALPRKSEDFDRGDPFGRGRASFEMLSSYLWEKPGRDGGRVVVVGQTVEVPAVNRAADGGGEDAASMMQRRMMMMAMMGESGTSRHASEVLGILSSPIEVNRLRNGIPDLEVAKKLEAGLASMEKDSFESYQIDSTAGGLARVLLFAAQLDERGHHEAANRLARLALTTPIGAEPVISGAITMLGEAAYATAFHRFSENGDKQAWKTDLEGILSKFSRGYANAIAVRLALADVTSSLEPKPLAHPEAEVLAKEWRSKKLDNAALKRLQDSLAIVGGGRNSRMSFMMGEDGEEEKPVTPWLLDSDLAKAEDPVGKLLAKGLEAIPILTALAADASATPTSTMFLLSGSGGYSSYSMSRSSEDEKALGYYRSGMPRPATVGEIATVLLASLLTGSPEQEGLPRPEEIGALVTAWLESLPERSPKALADHYFEMGNASQQAAMLRIFVANPDPTRLQKVEEFLLGSRPRENSIGLVREYLTSRGTVGADFLARYRKAVDEEMESATKDYFSRDWSVYEDSMPKAKKRVEGMLKMLDALVKGVEVEPLLRQMAESEDYEVLRETAGLLKPALDKLKPEEAVARWLTVLVEQKDPLTRGRLLGYANQLLRPSPMTESEKPAWKTLLEDERAAIGEEARERGYFGDSIPTVAQVAAGVWNNFNELEVENDQERQYRMFLVLGYEGLAKISLQRAKAAIAGETIPPWPDEEKLNPTETEALLAKLNAMPGGEVVPAIRALGLKERFTLASIEEPIEAYKKASWHVCELELHEESAKDFAFVKSWDGQLLTAAMVEQLIAGMKKSKMVGFDWLVGGSRSLPGLRVASNEASNQMDLGMELKMPAVVASLMAMPAEAKDSSEPIRLQAVFFDEKDLAALEADKRKGAEESLKKFNEGLAKALAHDPKRQLQVYLQFYQIIPGQEKPGF